MKYRSVVNYRLFFVFFGGKRRILKECALHEGRVPTTKTETCPTTSSNVTKIHRNGSTKLCNGK